MEVMRMFAYKSIREQLLDERKKNAELQAALTKANADIEYIAMMTDVDIETDDQEVLEDGNE
jgi:hypothetical protein